MALTPEQIGRISRPYGESSIQGFDHILAFAQAIEAEVRKRSEAITAARARLLDSELSQLTERGAKAWAGVDAQALRAGGASPSANAGEPSGHIKEPYTLAEIKAKIASNDYSAEMLLQHAMLLLDSVQEDAARLDFLIGQRAYVVSDPDACPGHWLHWAMPDGRTWVQGDEHPTPRAAIDAARKQGARWQSAVRALTLHI